MAHDIIEAVEKTAWDNHTTNIENPHVTTAEQVGALSTSGGSITGDVSVVGTATADLLVSNGNVNVTGDVIAQGALVGVDGAVVATLAVDGMSNTTTNTGRVVVAATNGTFYGKTVANFNTELAAASIGTDYSTSKVRGITASTTDLVAGSSSLSNGQIYVVYE